MKLLYVCSDFGIRPSGTKGASIHLRAITRALCDIGHDVQLLSPHAGPGKAHPVKRLLTSGRCPPAQSAENLRVYLKKRELPRQVAHDLRTLLYNPWVVPRALKVLERDPPDAIIERMSLFGHVGVDLSAALRRPLLVEVNALLSQEARQFRQLELVDLAEQIELRVLQQADAVMPVSSQLGRLLADQGVKSSRIHVVPNGAEIERFDPNDSGEAVRRRLKLNQAFVVGFAGSLKVWHGVEVLLTAFKRVVNHDPLAKLLIVGGGPTEADLRSAAVQAGLSNSVIFTGAVDHARIPSYLAAMDVVAAPYRAVENFYFSPIKVFEYMAAGRCIVASRLGQIEDVLTDGQNGLLCQPDDPDALTEALLKLRRDENLRRQLALAARQCAEEKYTWRQAAVNISDIIARRIAKSSGSSAAVAHREPGIGTVVTS